MTDCEGCEAEDCQECCPHDDADVYCCFGCGKDMMEDHMAMAYDRAKAARQDG